MAERVLGKDEVTSSILVGGSLSSSVFEEQAMNRSIISLECTVCKERNYSTTKNKRKSQDKLELSKFCPRCRKHTAHKEGKV